VSWHDLSGEAGWDEGIALSINDAGVVAVCSNNHAYLYDSAAFIPIGGEIEGLFGPDWSYPSGMNSLGHVTGTTGYQGFVYREGNVLDLGQVSTGAGDGLASVEDINASGQVVGQRSFDDDGFVCETSGSQPVFELFSKLPGYKFSRPAAINASGDIVGAAWNALDPLGVHAFLRKASGPHAKQLRALDSLIAAGSGWSISYATDVNDLGQIAGAGYLDGTLRPFLLSPIGIFKPPGHSGNPQGPQRPGGPGDLKIVPSSRAAIDPVARLLPSSVYSRWVEWKHPHVMKPGSSHAAALGEFLRQLPGDEQARVRARLIKIARDVKDLEAEIAKQAAL
jgi:hypothetical protein